MSDLRKSLESIQSLLSQNTKSPMTVTSLASRMQRASLEGGAASTGGAGSTSVRSHPSLLSPANAESLEGQLPGQFRSERELAEAAGATIERDDQRAPFPFIRIAIRRFTLPSSRQRAAARRCNSIRSNRTHTIHLPSPSVRKASFAVVPRQHFRLLWAVLRCMEMLLGRVTFLPADALATKFKTSVVTGVTTSQVTGGRHPC